MIEIKNNAHKGEEKDNINKALHGLLERFSNNLDISTLIEIIVTDDLVKEVTEFQNSKELKVEIMNNEHAVACAKTITFFTNNQLENIIFIHKDIVSGLLDQELSQSTTNIIHHELCHVHDNKLNYKYFGDRFLGEYYGNIFEVSTTHAHALFSEYVAECLSLSTKECSNSLRDSLNILKKMMKDRKSYIDKCLYKYYHNNNAIKYFNSIQLYSFELLRIITDICSLFNQIEDINNFDILITEVDKLCDLKEFNDIFVRLSFELKCLYDKYPPKKIDDYNKLANIVEECWKLMHLEIVWDINGVSLKIG